MTQTAPSLKGSYVKANGLNMYYEEYGSGEPLILHPWWNGGQATTSSLSFLLFPNNSESSHSILGDMEKQTTQAGNLVID